MKTFKVLFTDFLGNEDYALYDAPNAETAQEMFCAEYGDDFGYDGVVEADPDELIECNYDDSMDGDFDSAMASAGFGTDEDYGFADEVM
jgi:hypothetical protein